jgi:membrane protein DedA with SNARE-associated domain
MENDELKQLWSGAGVEALSMTKDELKSILGAKIQKSMNRFILITSVAALTSAGVLVFLLITGMERKSDPLYVINNLTLGILTITSLILSLVSWYRLGKADYSFSMSEMIRRKRDMISRSLYSPYRKVKVLVIPLLFVLTVMAINVFYSGMTYAEVLNSEESLAALIAGVVVGLPVSFYVERKLYKQQLSYLNELKDLYRQLVSVDEG